MLTSYSIFLDRKELYFNKKTLLLMSNETENLNNTANISGYTLIYLLLSGETINDKVPNGNEKQTKTK